MDDTPKPDDIPPVLPEERTVEFEEQEVNPFAPSVAEDAHSQAVGRTHLPREYWIAIACTTIVCALMSLVGNVFLAIMLIFALCFGSIRVPLVQRRVSRLHPERVLPRPILMLFISISFVLIMEIASGICFLAICIPTAIATGYGIFGGGSDVALVTIMGGSGSVGLLCFLGMYLYSLKLPV